MVCAPQVRFWVAFYGLVKIREFIGVLHKENGSIVPGQVPIAFLGIELQGEAPDVPFGIRSAPFPCNGRKTGKHIGLFPYFGKYFCLGVSGNVMGYGKSTKSSRSLCMHSSLRNYLPVKMGQFLQEPKVFQEHRTPLSRSFYILILRYRSSGDRSKFLLLVIHDL